MAEFCPKCSKPLHLDPLTPDDPGRLCDKCGWFGDKSETQKEPPITDDNETSVLQSLALYRDICRDEIACEHAYLTGEIPFTELQRFRALADSSIKSLLLLYHVLNPENPEQPE